MVDSRAGAIKIQVKPGTPSGLESREEFKKGGEGEDILKAHRSQSVRGFEGQNRKKLSKITTTTTTYWNTIQE